MYSVWQDIRIGIKNHLSTPGATLIALLTLSLGIGANIAIFSVLNAVALRPLAIPHPEQFVALSTTIPGEAIPKEPFTVPMFIELSRRQQSFEHMFAWYGGKLDNFEVNGRHLTAALASVSGEYYQAMQITPLFGRLIDKGDVAIENGTSNRVAVISYRAWRSWYLSDAEVVGKVIRIEDQSFTIIGVEPEGYSGLIIDGSTDVTVPLFSTGLIGPRNPRDPRVAWINVYARIRTGVTLAQAQAAIETLWPGTLAAARPVGYDGLRLERFNSRHVTLQSASRGVSSLRDRFSPSLFVLLGLVSAVLLIACLNVANLSSARLLARQHEFGVRTALGASPWDLVRLPLIESFLLSSIGAVFAIFLAYGMSRTLLQTAWTGLVSTQLSTLPDIRVLVFTATVTLISGLLFSAAPAWFALHSDSRSALSQRNRSIHGGATMIGKTLLVGQISLSLLLIMAAILFGETLSRLHTVDVGYRRDHLLTMVLFPQPGTNQRQIPLSYYEQLADKIKGVPGVESASFSYLGPATETSEAEPVYDSTKLTSAEAVSEIVAPNFFRVVGMHLLSGREFTWQDGEQNPKPAIISESLAERLFPHENPIGRIAYVGPVAHAQQVAVIGVVNSASLWNVRVIHPLAIYQPPALGFADLNPLLDIHTVTDPRSLKATTERAVQSLGRHYSLRTLTGEERLDSVLSVQRITAMLAVFFGIVALLIASIGLYGLLLIQVTDRTVELGIRLALGARGPQVWGLVLRQLLVWVGVGCTLGSFLSFAVLRLAAKLLFGISPMDPVVLVFAVLILVSVAMLAALIPARRAAAIDPITALRAE